ncbi:MAG: TrbI/VirB10 family protein [Pegethrix bostrychoides GSE-TBD4-15B]|uniref:TrbI/VirB10 family protein n=1 Tax=Pegethrix bostrychoides GSE-TBD4-15B TaxID=2839662 RepID=A0A951PBD0_9CYAN|nr:TrbI/VirB10 family protein [Pegethrix bostrychoides GSE-TBD4-15B]
MTTEDLRRLTQAPSHQPLLTEAEFSVEAARSHRPRWTQPLPKFALVGTILFPIFGLVCWFVLGGGDQHQQAGTSAQDGSVAQSQTPTDRDLARLREENARLKAGMALNDQAEIEQRMRQARAQTKTPKVAPTAKPTAQARPAPARATSVAQPRPQTYAPQPFRNQPAPVRRPTSTPAPSRARSVDPMQQWQQLAQLGSYGSIQPERIASMEFSSSRQRLGGQRLDGQRIAQAVLSVPTAQIAPTSAVQSISDRLKTAPPRRISELQDQMPKPASVEPDASESTVPLPEVQATVPILQEAEATILESDSNPQSLIAGTSSPAVLVTPIVVNGSGSSDQFAAVLAEPLTGSRGRVAFPAGTQFLFQVERLSRTGQVHLTATTATWEVNGAQQELVLPAGAVQIRGEAGEPLLAEHYQDRGDEIAGMDAGQFALGAIGRAAELYTRSDTRVQTRGSSTIITEDNPAPNILAGLIEGGTDAILETIQERNQRAVERLEELPNARFIKAGTPVQIFVNQSMFMPM